MLQLLVESCCELCILPLELLASFIANIAIPFEEKGQSAKQRLHVHIIGGAGGPSFFYEGMRNHLQETVGRYAHITTPKGLILRVDGTPSSLLGKILFGNGRFGIENYVDRFSRSIDESDEEDIILVTHSLGYLAALRICDIMPHRIRKAIFLAPPTNPQYTNHWLIEWVMRNLIGIDYDSPFLEYVREILADEEMRAKLLIVSSNGDYYCPLRVGHMEGVSEQELPNIYHKSFAHHPDVLAYIRRMVRNEARKDRNIRRVTKVAV